MHSALEASVFNVRHLRRQFHWWREIRKLYRHLPQSAARSAPESTVVRRLLIMPSDPWTLVGSKGDEAMIQAVVDRLRRRQPSLHVGTVIAGEGAMLAAERLGFEPVRAWDCDLDDAVRSIREFDPDALIVLGADVLDGYYGPVTPARMLLMADAAAREGIRATVLGFSFNQHPNPLMRPVFEGLHDKVVVNVRDSVSLERFRSFCNVRARLVADAAFLLEPDGAGAKIREAHQWAQERRAAGDRVIGFNLHPMLVQDPAPEALSALVESATRALQALSERRSVSWLLISHDYRTRVGDDVCLRDIEARLSAALGPRLQYSKERHSAAELKALAGTVDGVVTGRMHLAIATLGMSRPVAALTYQDKFEGLFQHFGLPEHLMLKPADAISPQGLERFIERFIDELPALSAQVASMLPRVEAAAELNIG